jgi:hypothetical protein
MHIGNAGYVGCRRTQMEEEEDVIVFNLTLG